MCHVGKFLEIVSIKESMKNIPVEYMKYQGYIKGMVTIPFHSNQKSTDIFLSLDGVIYVIVNSKKSKGRELTKWLINKGLDKIQQEHQQAIEAHQLAIEDLQATEYENFELQLEVQGKNAEIADFVANRRVPRRDGIDTVLCPVVKNDPDEAGKPGRHEYYIIRCQRRVLKYHINCLRLRYPDMTVKKTCDDGNAIHRFSRFTKDVLQKPNFYRNHFNLVDESHRDLFYTLFNIDMEDPEDDADYEY